MRTASWLFVSWCLACSAAPRGPERSPVEPSPPPAAARDASPVAFAVPALFADHMVMQRDRPNPIWGFDAPG
ncbi:MAG TPA: hypothetical protein VFZ53_07735, partial [Polyangiaceae bacterium]